MFQYLTKICMYAILVQVNIICRNVPILTKTYFFLTIDEKKLVNNQGCDGKTADKDVKGGEPGEPGSYGLDHVIYVDGLFSDRTNKKGDYSNYILEKSLDKNMKEHVNNPSKYKTKSILEDPDLYAKRSASYTVFTSVMLVGFAIVACVVAAPFVAASAAVLPAIGAAAWATGAVLAAKVVVLGTLALAGASIFCTVKTVSGLSATQGVNEKKKLKNRAQITFNNRYCDEPWLRNEADSRQNSRHSQNSRGKQGEQSKEKEEKERDEHGKAKETENEFEDEYEMASLNQKAQELKTDAAKAESMDALNAELNSTKQEEEACQASLKVCDERVAELTNEFGELNRKIDETQRQKQEIEQKISEIESVLNVKESKLSESQQQMMNDVEAYLNTLNKEVSSRIQLEFAKISETSKLEVQQRLREACQGIRQILDEESQALMGEKAAIQREIDSKTAEKDKKLEEMESLRSQELNSIRNRVNSEKEVSAMEAMQKKLKSEMQKEKNTSTVAEVMVMKEFKADSKKEASGPAEDQVNYEIKLQKRVISEEVYKSLFVKKGINILSGKPTPLNEVIASLKEYAVKNKTSEDILLGQLEFIIFAYSRGLYELIKANLQNEDGQDKVVSKEKENKKEENKEYKQFKPAEMFEKIKTTPFLIDKFYAMIVSCFFKEKLLDLKPSYAHEELSAANFLDKCGLEVHYEDKTGDLSQLEKDLLYFVCKIRNNMQGRDHLFKSIRLIKDYSTKLGEVCNMSYPAVGIIALNANRFFNTIIRSIRQSIDVGDEKKWAIWSDLDLILELIELVDNQLRKLNAIELWKNMGLMQNEQNLLKILIGDVKIVSENKKEIDALKKTQISVFKVELIEEYLQLRLVDILLKKVDIEAYNGLKANIQASKIVTRQDKDEFMFHLKLAKSQNTSKKVGVSQQGFLLKFGQSLSLKSADPFNFELILERILQSNKADNLMRSAYSFLLQEHSTAGFEELIEIYSKLASAKSNSALLTKIEIILSDRIEEQIKKRLSYEKVDEFADEIASGVKDRINGVEGQLGDIVLRKSAFYTRIHSVLNGYKNKKGDNDADLALKSILVLNLARGGGMGKSSIREFSPKEKEFFNKLECKTPSDSKNPAEFYEEVVFNLSELQYNMMKTSMGEMKKDLAEKLKVFETDFLKMQKEIQKVDSDNAVILGMKNYLLNLEKSKQSQERTKKLLSLCAKGKEEAFLKQLKVFRDEFLKESQDAPSLSEHIIRLVSTSLDEQFKEDWVKRNEFLVACVNFYDSNKENDSLDYVYDLFCLIEIQELIKRESYAQLVQYLDFLTELNVENQALLKVKSDIEVKYQLMVNDVINVSSQLEQSYSTNKDVCLVLSTFSDLAQEISSEILRENFFLLDNLFKVLANLKTHNDESDLVKSAIEVLEKNLKSQFESIQSTFSIDSQNELVYQIFSFITMQISNVDKNKMNRLFSNFLFYFKLRLNLLNSKKLDKEILEENLCKMLSSSSKINISMELIFSANRILDDYLLLELIAESANKISVDIDLKRQGFEAITYKYLKFYESQLGNKSELIKKGKINFLCELIDILHKTKLKKDINDLDQFYKSLDIQTEAKEASPKEIENFLIEKVNALSLLGIPEILGQNAVYKDKKVKNVNDLFELIFGDMAQKGAPCLIKDFIGLFNVKEGASDKKDTKKLEEDLFKAINEYGNLTYDLLEGVYFGSFEQQNVINELSNELVSHFDYFLYAKKERNPLASLKVDLGYLFQLKCYKMNNYLNYVDRQPITFELYDLKSEIYSLVRNTEELFDDINLALAFESDKNMYKKSNIVLALNEKSKSLHQELWELNEAQAKLKINEIIQFVESHRETSEAIKSILKKRSAILEILNSKSDVKKLFELTNADLDLLPINLKSDLVALNKSKLQSRIFIQMRGPNCDLRLTKQLIKIKSHLEDIDNLNVQLKLYLLYSNTFESSENINCEELNRLGVNVLQKIHQVEVNSDFVNKSLESLTQKGALAKTNIIDLNNNIKLCIAYLSNDKLNKKVIAEFMKCVRSRIQDAPGKNKEYIALSNLILEYFHKNSNYDKTITSIMDRLVQIAELKTSQMSRKSAKKDYKSLSDLWEIFLGFDEKIKHVDVINKILAKFSLESFMSDFLSKDEIIFTKYLKPEVVKKTILDKYMYLWKDSLENEYISSVSEALLEEEKNMLEKNLTSGINGDNFKKELRKLIRSLYFDDAVDALNKAKIYLELKTVEEAKNVQLLNSLKIFKDFLFIIKELKLEKTCFVDLFEALRKKKCEKKINLEEATEILMYSRLFDENVNEFIKIISSDSSDLIRQVVLSSLGTILNRMFKCDDKQKETAGILEKLYKNLQNNENDFLKLVLNKINFDHMIGLKYEKSEVELLKNIIDMCLVVGVFEKEKASLRESLEQIQILKWSTTLRIEIVKYELNTSDKELINDILYIEKNRGVEITKQFIRIIKNVEVEEVLLKYLARKFKKNEWELNSYVLELMAKEKDAHKWIELIKKYDLGEKTKDLSATELITQMKRLEGVGEINSYIKELLNRNKDNKCILELCLENIAKIYKKKSTLCPNVDKKLCDFEDKHVKEWTEAYKKVSKVNLESINCSVVLELVAVISRASKLINGHDLRATQMISLLTFIDSILFSPNGRLANISTGEGKSLITISTAISQLLIKGGKVDILTSSEVLAERDAEESYEMFDIFGISVSNNCDADANANEKLRRERYEKNAVVYGEIGHFQRDILLTKYYDKDIRKELASCLIIDEVDSMCIDNMCNTLYISHQIADLRYLKEIYCYIWQAVNARDTWQYSVANVEKVKEYIEKLSGDKQLHFPSNLKEFIARRLKIWINNAYVAKEQIEEGIIL